MTGMTPERLAEIEADLSHSWKHEPFPLARDLLAEVNRLRAGVGAVLSRTTDRYAADDLVDLLNPTEGGD